MRYRIETTIIKWESGIIDISVPDQKTTYRIKQGNGVFHVSEFWATEPSQMLVECATLEQAYAEVFRLIIE
jgi:hypothetical protein